MFTYLNKASGFWQTLVLVRVGTMASAASGFKFKGNLKGNLKGNFRVNSLGIDPKVYG